MSDVNLGKSSVMIAFNYFFCSSVSVFFFLPFPLCMLLLYSRPAVFGYSDLFIPVFVCFLSAFQVRTFLLACPAAQRLFPQLCPGITGLMPPVFLTVPGSLHCVFFLFSLPLFPAFCGFDCCFSVTSP